MKLSSMPKFKNENLEVSVIKALLEPTTFWEYSNRLSIDMFTDQRRSYFERLARAVEDETQVSFVNELPADIEQVDKLDDALQTLKGLHKLRLFADANQESIDSMNKGVLAPIELISSHVEKVETIRDSFEKKESKSAVDYFHDALGEIKERVELRKQGIKYPGIETGFNKLDIILSGMQAGLHLLAARPGMGKTTFANNLVYRAAKQEVPVLYVSYEEPPSRLALKTLCIPAQLEFRKCFHGHESMVSKVQGAFEEHGDYLKYIDFIWGDESVTPEYIELQAKRLLKMHSSKRVLVVIDYLQNWAKQKQGMDTTTAVSKMVLKAKEISKKLNSPVLCISSQNRASHATEGKDAELNSLKDSGDLEYTADVAMFLSQGTHSTTNPIKAVDLHIKKNRFGWLDKVSFNFDQETCTFSEDGAEVQF